jgi:RNA polymerase sigma-70 factor (ECF subfamily)
MDLEVERDLVQRARAGSLDAFDSLIRAHQDQLFRFLVVRGASRADAEDIVQDTFLAAWRYLDGYRERWRFSTWLYTIARRRALGRRANHVDLPETLIDGAQNPEAIAHSGQQRDNLWSTARELLPSDWLDALWLFYAEDRKTRDIARILGRSTAWVKITLYRSRQRLAQHIDAKDWLAEEVISHE